jgi:hypothetical protein
MSTADDLEQAALIQLEKLMKSDKESTLGDCSRALAVAWQIRNSERQFEFKFEKKDDSDYIRKLEESVAGEEPQGD